MVNPSPIQLGKSSKALACEPQKYRIEDKWCVLILLVYPLYLEMNNERMVVSE